MANLTLKTCSKLNQDLKFFILYLAVSYNKKTIILLERVVAFLPFLSRGYFMPHMFKVVFVANKSSLLS